MLCVVCFFVLFVFLHLFCAARIKSIMKVVINKDDVNKVFKNQNDFLVVLEPIFGGIFILFFLNKGTGPSLGNSWESSGYG